MDTDAEVAAARIGRTVGSRWRLESVLGIGGMAAVYQARDPNGTIAAIKILHPEMSARAEVRERFLREGYAANKIGHPGVVQALEHGDNKSDVFLAMELLEGETLRARVHRHGRLPVGEVLDYAEQILEVLVAAHAQGVIHRDLKPDNLFVTNHGRIKVLDFGLARMMDGVPGQHRTRTGVALGTLAYMAPEQALGRRAEIDGRVDIFALGATLFRILSGRRVHEAESEAELLMAMASRPAPPLASVARDIPEPVAAVVNLALAFSRDARYPDANLMLGDVRALRAGGVAPYATARLASRDEATRADGTGGARTQPLEAKPASSPRVATVPLAAYQSPSMPAPPPGFPPQEPPPISFRPPASARGDGYAGPPPNSLQGYAQPAAVAQTAYGTTVPATPPAGVPGPAAPKKGGLGLVLVLGGVLLVGAGGLIGVVLMSRSAGDLDATVGPQRASGVPVSSVAAAAAEAAPAVPATPAVAVKQAPNAAAPAEPQHAATSAAAAARTKPEAKRAAAAKPGAEASAAAPTPPSPPSPSPSPAPAPAPTQTAAPAPSPLAPTPPAPTPNADQSPAPVPSPSAGPPPNRAEEKRRGQPPGRRGKGNGQRD